MLGPSPSYHALLLLLLVGTQSFFTVLAVLNVRHSERIIDMEDEWLSDVLAIDDPNEVVAYNRLKAGLGHLQSWIGLAVLILLLYSGVLTNIVHYLDSTVQHSLIAGVIFFIGLVVALQLFAAPFDIIDTFVIEELFDFNNQSIGLWLRDAVLGLAVSILLTTVVAGALLLFIMSLPTWWWLAAALFFIAFTIVMQVIYPRGIAPLFNDFHPIDAGDLKDGVESVFDRAGFACEQLYTMDASRRSNRVNAYFVGFGGTKRVVLFDTLVDRLELEEIQSVLAHELAHWKFHHVWKQLVGSMLRITGMLFLLWYLLETTWVYDLFGLPHDAVYAGLFVGLLFVTPLLRLTAPLENRLSLAHEREADRFAVSVMGEGESMIEALARLASENLSNPFPHPWYATFHHSHPPIPERIRAIRDAAAGED